MKRKTILFVNLLFCLSLLIIQNALSEEYGICDHNLSWVLNDNGVLTINGNGIIANYNAYSYLPPWYSCRLKIKSVSISDGITGIGTLAFYQCSNLQSINISNTVASIQNNAFDGCNNLSNIIVDNNNGYFSSYKGALLNKNKSILLFYPNGLKGAYTIPDGIKTIGNEAFYHCANLTDIVLPDSLVSIGNMAFSGCINLTSIKIPSNVISLGNGSFSGCENITTVELPNSLQRIDDSCFNFCTKMTTITIPPTVRFIGNYVFSNCDELTEINVSENNKYYSSQDGVLFNKTKTVLIYYPIGKVGDYTIPDGVISIGHEAFYRCMNIISVRMSNSVLYIESSAFEGCINLSTIHMSNNITDIGIYAFRDCYSLKNILFSEGTNTKEVVKCYFNELITIVLPSSLNKIGEDAFYGTMAGDAIEVDFFIPMSIQTIEEYAFSGISATYIYFNNNIQSIDNRAFYQNKYLRYVFFESPNVQIADDAFEECFNLIIIGPDYENSLKDYAEEHGFVYIGNECSNG